MQKWMCALHSLATRLCEKRKFIKWMAILLVAVLLVVGICLIPGKGEITPVLGDDFSTTSTGSDAQTSSKDGDTSQSTDSTVLSSDLQTVSDSVSSSTTETEKPSGIGTVDSSNSIILYGSQLPVDSYTLKYESNEVPLSEYADICTLKITDAGRNAKYDGFIRENCAPVAATAIGVYNSSNKRVGAIPLGSLKPFSDLGEKLYSFGALSDVHIQSNTAEEDYERALTYLNTVEKVKFINVAGDLTQTGTREQLADYKKVVSKYSPNTPVYEITGNHEGQQSDIADYIADYTGESIYYSYTYGNDVFIMVGNTAAANEIFSSEELNWLYETLEANKDKRCFVFQHVFNDDVSAKLMLSEGDIWDGVDAAVYDSLMEHYPNVTWFHGHSHLKFILQENYPTANYDGSKAYHSVHIPSVAVPEYKSENNTITKYYDESEGYVVDVYKNGIVLRGRDFANGKFLPIAQYCLNTKTKTVKANSYCDKTGTILNSNTNVLKSGASWYAGSVGKNTITKISFVNGGSKPKCDESWDATVNKSGKVMVYRTGTELTVAGGENGIALNANSANLFEDFSSVTEISGLETLYTSNLTEFSGAFKNCRSLKSVDISSFDFNNVRNLNGLFQGCSSLVAVELPNNLNVNPVIKYTNVTLLSLFEGCSSLESADLSFLPKDNIYNITYAFKDCAALKTVNLGNIKIGAAGSTFYKCRKLTKVDMRGVDFSNCTNIIGMFRECSALSTVKLPSRMDTSKITNMSAVFYNCGALTLNCSGWNTDSCTTVSEFNYKAPGVVAPVLD